MKAPRYWCDKCDAPAPFEAHRYSPFVLVCTHCGHHRVDRNRPVTTNPPRRTR